MDNPIEGQKAAFQAMAHSVRDVPSRGVVSLVVELPIEMHETVARICPHGTWLAIARLDPAAVEQKQNGKLKRNWNDLPPASQAALLCKDAEFWLYIKADNEEAAVQYIYTACGVDSRAELSVKQEAGERWERLVEQFRVWQRARA